MKILIAHNYYQQPGGEKEVVVTEAALLREYGEDVQLYVRHNTEFKALALGDKVRYLANLHWSEKAYQDMRAKIREFHPDVVHFHNIFYMMTPSVYYACRDESVPIVQSLHNFRLLCANGLLLRNNKPCEKCIERKSLWWGVAHRCFRRCTIKSAAVVKMVDAHWKKGTWVNLIDRYIVVSRFSGQKFIGAGIPAEKISVKPNFVHPSHLPREKDKGYAIYMGRLSDEKGVEIIIRAWKDMPDIPLRIIGSGPQEKKIKEMASGLKQVTFYGYVTHEECLQHLKGARFLISPSVCYENGPRSIIEAYSYGVPVLASRLGSMEEIVKEGKTGLLFNPGDARDLFEQAKWLNTHPAALEEMNKFCREEFYYKYSGEKNYQQLMKIYRDVIASRGHLELTEMNGPISHFKI